MCVCCCQTARPKAPVRAQCVSYGKGGLVMCMWGVCIETREAPMRAFI